MIAIENEMRPRDAIVDPELRNLTLKSADMAASSNRKSRYY